MPERRVSLKDLIVSVARRRRSINAAVLVTVGKEGARRWSSVLICCSPSMWHRSRSQERLAACLCLSVHAGAKHFLFASSFAMIRRNPTLIPMNDLDVQDIRDMVAKQKADQQLMQKMKRLVESPEILKEDFNLMAELRGSIKDKVRRMGLDMGIDSAKT
jgi:hypothetical protein